VLGVEYAVGAAAMAEDSAQAAAKSLDLDRVSEAPSEADRSLLNDRSMTSKRHLIEFINYCFLCFCQKQAASKNRSCDQPDFPEGPHLERHDNLPQRSIRPRG
jgi:hypothetical protein